MKLCPKCQKHFSDDANFCPVDAARLVPLDSGAGAGLDSLTSKFDLGERLGGSRTGAVHRAVDKASGKPCIVKLVSPAVVALPGVAQRIERELKQLERVQSVGVAHVLASGKRGEEFWVATELLEGAQTLAEAITARGPIPVDQAANLIELIGEALIEAAQVGVVHRDLAPKNILFAGQEVKLINFSLPVPTTDKVPGVPEFVAPEQVEGRPVDQRSNLYSLGALYYYVLTGQTIFAGDTQEVHRHHAAGGIKPPSQLVPMPQPLENVIMRALDRSPTKRFLTVRQFVDEVTRVGHGEVIELKATMAMGRAGRPKGELVQTLLGVRSNPGGGGAAAQPHVQMGPPQMPAPLPAQTPAPLPAQPTVQSGPPAMPAPMAPAMASAAPAEPSRSPWAPPGGAAPQPAAQHAAVAAAAPAPVVQPPVLPTPAVQPPIVAQPSNKKKQETEDEAKGKFRETMWFKKGDLDSQAAQAAAEERARTGKDVADKADSKPLDERYNDDGTITRGDKEKYSLRTNQTQNVPKVSSKTSQSVGKVSEDELIGEMKKGRGLIIVAILIALAALIAIAVMLAT